MKRALLATLALVAATSCSSARPDEPPTFNCSVDNPDVCWREARATPNRSSAEAVAKFEVACRASGYKHRATACTWAALGLEKQELERALSLHEFACDRGIATSCTRLGNALLQSILRSDPNAPETQTTRDRVLQLARPVCAASSGGAEAEEFGSDPRGMACAAVGTIQQIGFGAPPDPASAFSSFRRACDFETAYACSSAADFKALGTLGDHDARAAAKLYGAACDLGFERACPQRQLMELLSSDLPDRPARLVALLDERADRLGAELPTGDVADKEWVGARLDIMFEVDQLYRRATTYRAHLPSAEADQFSSLLGARVGEVDNRHLEEFKAIVSHWNWLTISEFGQKTADQAWLIVQHADGDIAFQKEVLSRFESLLEREEIAPSHFAYLYDRVAVNEGREQRFGTQGGCDDGTWQPKPIENDEAVDERRASVGLAPLSEYRQQFAGACR